MKLTFTQQELEEGVSIRRVGEKQREKIRSAMVTQGAFSLTPIPLKGMMASGVIVYSMEPIGTDGMHKITLQPVAFPVYEVHEKGGDLKAVVVELPDKQLQIEADTVREVRVTLRGPGADPDMIEKARVAFGKLIANSASHPVVRGLIQLVRDYRAK
jgi:hypothetical protein